MTFAGAALCAGFQHNMRMPNSRFDTRVLVFHLVLAGGLLAVPGQAATERMSSARSAATFDAASWSNVDLGRIDPKVFSIALEAASAAVARGDADPATLTIIDFSQPSTSKRLWVYDLRSRRLLFEEAVAHGRKSGHNRTTTFSNEPGSFQSSLGLFRTAESYTGKHGYSLRLDGLEPGVNDRARERAIVVHGAEYVNLGVARQQGRLGRSLGCPAVRPEVSRPLINAIKDGGLLFAYYPHAEYLATSTYLN
jgi:hypothetical protein